jgi:uncharacterized damage-inducible protein DinB
VTSTAKTLLGVLGMTDRLVPPVLEDITDAQARSRSRRGEGPSIAWMIGHLLHYRYYMLGVLRGEGSSPFGDMFTKDASDGDDYPTVEELGDRWTAVAADFQDAIRSKSEADFDGPGGPHSQQPLRDQLTFFAWHEGYHIGALGAIRKSMGLEGPAEKLRASRKK